MTTTNTQSYYSTMSNQDDHLFNDEQIQRFDADTIKNRYGENWKIFASNVREITQPDGSIVKEYIIEDPSLLEEIKTSSRPIDLTSSKIGSDDQQQQQQQSLKTKFAQIKAKFEQKNFSNVMASPSTTNSNSTTTRQNSRKQIDDLYARHRRASNESIPINRINNDDKNSIGSSNHSTTTQNTSHRSHSIGSDKSKTISFRRFNSADEADEEVSRIHRQGEELRRQKREITPVSSLSNEVQQQSRSQFEIIDEDGNPIVINNVQDLIKMSGVHARQVPQPDGTIIKEYVIDDPQLLSQFRSQQQQQQSPMTSSYIQQQSIYQDAPPPPPRIPLRPSILFRQGESSVNDHLPYNIQQIHVLEPQRRYEYLTTTGRRIQFFITNSDSFNGQLITDLDIRELTNAINLRLLPSSNPIIQQQEQHQSLTQPPFNLPKQWYPSVDLTHRQRIGSDSRAYSNNTNIGFQQIPTDLTRSASSDVLNQGSYPSQNQQQVFNEPVNGWNTFRYQDSHNQNHQNNETFQTSAQFLPQQQMTRSTYSPSINNHQLSSSFHQQSTTYPYQGQQQHDVRTLNDFNQQRTAIINDGHTRI